jgi:LuxR family maltose regulon positive regulatory protein
LEGIQLMRGWQQPYEMASGYTTLAAILQAAGDVQSAREALQHAARIQAQHPSYYKLGGIVKLCRIRLCLAQEGPEAAARQALEDRLGETEPLLYREQERIVLARVRVAQKRWEEALQLLDPLARDAEAGGRAGRLIRMLALQAVALRQQGEDAQALKMLEQALALGERQGYRRTFVDLGAAMARLLHEAVARGLVPDYAGKLLAGFPDREAIPAVPSERPAPQPGLIEPLTERELEVLDLIGQGYSNRQISKVLVISLNTVKKHASGIYGKLGVHSRTQAVARAQELGLL